MLGRPTGIYVVPAEGGDAEELTRTSAMDVSPSWSPDGTKIAFCREADAESLRDEDRRGDRRQVTKGLPVFSLTWQPLR